MHYVVSRVASWPASHLLLAGFAAVAISMFARPAEADEAYLCGPDSVIYVSVADLPQMKKTNACIAAYYGLTIEAAVVTPAVAKQTSQGKPISKARPKLDGNVALKPLLEPDTSARAVSGPIRQASLARPETAPGTDYRNVRVLNATDGDEAVFHHTK